MLTATTQDVEQRVKEGFLALLAQGQSPDEAIKIGRAAAEVAAGLQSCPIASALVNAAGLNPCTV